MCRCVQLVVHEPTRWFASNDPSNEISCDEWLDCPEKSGANLTGHQLFASHGKFWPTSGAESFFFLSTVDLEFVQCSKRLIKFGLVL